MSTRCGSRISLPPPEVGVLPFVTVDISSKFTYNRKIVRATFKPIQMIRLGTYMLVRDLSPPAKDVERDDDEMHQSGGGVHTRAEIALDPNLL